MIDNPWFYAAAIPALMIFGISKGGFGGGIGLVAVPLISLTVSPAAAAAVMLPMLCLMDLIGLKHYWGKWHGRLMKIMIPASLVGVAIGSLLFDYLSDSWIRLLLGIISVVFAAEYFLRPGERAARELRSLPAVIAAAAGGFTSTIAHAGGPPVNVYVLPLKLDKTVFVASMTLLFSAINYTKLVTYSWIGLFNSEVLLVGLILAPVAAFGMWTGIWLHSRVRQQLFMRLCYLFVLIIGLKLLFDGVTA